MRLILSLLVLVWAMTCPAPAQQPHASSDQTSGSDFRAQVEKQTFLLVNQYRKEQGMPMLTWSDAVAKEARRHSADMATGDVDFGHDGFHDRLDHLKDTLRINGAGENVFMTSTPDDVAKMALNSWLHSPHHLKNIRGDYNLSGLGVAQSKEGFIYFTQLFVRSIAAPPAETSAPLPSATPLGVLASPFVPKTR